MAKDVIKEEKISKLISFILGAIFSGKPEKVTSKVSTDKELVKKIKDADKSYQNMIKYLEKKYGKEMVRAAKEKADKSLRQQGFNV